MLIISYVFWGEFGARRLRKHSYFWHWILQLQSRFCSFKSQWNWMPFCSRLSLKATLICQPGWNIHRVWSYQLKSSLFVEISNRARGHSWLGLIWNHEFEHSFLAAKAWKSWRIAICVYRACYQSARVLRKVTWNSIWKAWNSWDSHIKLSFLGVDKSRKTIRSCVWLWWNLNFSNCFN